VGSQKLVKIWWGGKESARSAAYEGGRVGSKNVL